MQNPNERWKREWIDLSSRCRKLCRIGFVSCSSQKFASYGLVVLLERSKTDQVGKGVECGYSFRLTSSNLPGPGYREVDGGIWNHHGAIVSGGDRNGRLQPVDYTRILVAGL
jgi:hypothetical protein